MKNRENKLLFIGNTRLGDCIMSTGLLDDLCEFYQAKATVICGALGEDIYSRYPFTEKVITLRKQKFSFHWYHLWKKIKGTRWDVLCDLRSTPVTLLVRAKKRIILNKNKKTSQHRVTGLARLNPYSRNTLPRIWLKKEDLNQGKDLLLGHSPPFFVICPSANWEAKVWPEENFTQLSKNIMNSNYFKGGTLIIVGGPGEEEVGKIIMKKLGKINIINLIGLPIIPTAAVFCFSKLYIGNDSGLMHLAASIGTPTIGLFGPTDDNIYAPLGKNTMVVRTPESSEELMSDPDFNHRTSGSLMKSLTINKVEKIAFEMLRKL